MIRSNEVDQLDPSKLPTSSMSNHLASTVVPSVNSVRSSPRSWTAWWTTPMTCPGGRAGVSRASPFSRSPPAMRVCGLAVPADDVGGNLDVDGGVAGAYLQVVHLGAAES